MPIQIYRRQQPQDDSLAQAIIAGTQGFIQGRGLREKSAEKSLANLYRESQLRKLQREEDSYNQPVPTDPLTGQPLFLPTPGGRYSPNPTIPKDELSNLRRTKLYSSPSNNSASNSDPIIRTGIDEATGQRVGQTQSGRIIPL